MRPPRLTLTRAAAAAAGFVIGRNHQYPVLRRRLRGLRRDGVAAGQRRRHQLELQKRYTSLLLFDCSRSSKWLQPAVLVLIIRVQEVLRLGVLTTNGLLRYRTALNHAPQRSLQATRLSIGQHSPGMRTPCRRSSTTEPTWCGSPLRPADIGPVADPFGSS